MDSEFVVDMFIVHLLSVATQLLYVTFVFVTHAGCIVASVGIAFRHFCLSVCLRSKRKMA